MKLRFYGLVLILVLCSAAFSADINNEAQLQIMWEGGGSHTIAAGTYTLESDLTAPTDNLILVPEGNVVIDGADTYNARLGGGTHVIGDSTGTYRISFTQGDSDTVLLTSAVTAMTATFYTCDFNNSSTTNGFSVSGDPAAAVTVTLNDCRATGNAADGFSLLTGNTNAVVVKMILNDCNSYSNGSSSNDQGVTAHSAKQYIYINGGTYHDNYAAGVYNVGGSITTISGATFWQNGTSGAGYDVGTASAGLLTIDNCTFYGLNATSYGANHISIGTGATGTFITNCTFRDSAGGYGTSVNIGYGLGVVENCIFDSVSLGANQYCLTFGGSVTGAYVKNCTFYNYTRGVNVDSVPESQIVNCIFSTAGQNHIRDDLLEYFYNSNNGYNLFYAHTTSIFFDDTNSYNSLYPKSTDIVGGDPKFVDAAGGDFRLLPTSPCLNAGRQTSNSGYTTIGAWQPGYEQKVIYRGRTPVGRYYKLK